LPTLTGPVATTFDSFGALLRFLRRRARLTQRELGLQVGYSEGHICRLEQNSRLPEPSVLAALFVPALRLDRDPAAAVRLMELAKQARGDGVGRRGDGTAATDLAVPPVPPPPAHAVGRPEVLAGLRSLLAAERAVVVCGLAGTGKSTVAATLAREESARDRVCWITATPGVTTAPEALVRQLAAHLNVVRLLERGTDAPSLPLDQQLDLLGPALAAEPTLVCLDNGQNLGEPALAALGHLAAAGQARLLVCSREPLALAGPATFRLAGLDREQGLELVARLDPEMPVAVAERLTARTAGSPMLLRLALGQARQAGTDRAASSSTCRPTRRSRRTCCTPRSMGSARLPTGSSACCRCSASRSTCTIPPWSRRARRWTARTTCWPGWTSCGGASWSTIRPRRRCTRWYAITSTPGSWATSAAAGACTGSPPPTTSRRATTHLRRHGTSAGPGTTHTRPRCSPAVRVR